MAAAEKRAFCMHQRPCYTASGAAAAAPHHTTAGVGVLLQGMHEPKMIILHVVELWCLVNATKYNSFCIDFVVV